MYGSVAGNRTPGTYVPVLPPAIVAAVKAAGQNILKNFHPHVNLGGPNLNGANAQAASDASYGYSGGSNYGYSGGNTGGSYYAPPPPTQGVSMSYYGGGSYGGYYGGGGNYGGGTGYGYGGPGNYGYGPASSSNGSSGGGSSGGGSSFGGGSHGGGSGGGGSSGGGSNPVSSILNSLLSKAASGLGPSNASNSYTPPGVIYTGAPSQPPVLLFILIGGALVLAMRKG